MSIVSGLAVYFMTWWVVLFMVLPWGVNVPDIREDEAHANSAPSNPDIKKKFVITTAVSAIVWLVIYFLVSIEAVNFYEIGN